MQNSWLNLNANILKRIFKALLGINLIDIVSDFSENRVNLFQLIIEVLNLLT